MRGLIEGHRSFCNTSLRERRKMHLESLLETVKAPP